MKFKLIKSNVQFENSGLLKHIAMLIEDGYNHGISPDWELKIYVSSGKELRELNLSGSAYSYICDTCAYPIKDGYMSYMDVQVINEPDYNVFDERDLKELGIEKGEDFYVDYELELDDELKEQLEEGL